MDDDDVFVDPVSADLSFKKDDSFKSPIYIQQSITSCTWTLRYEHLDIGHSDASQNYEKMGT